MKKAKICGEKAMARQKEQREDSHSNERISKLNQLVEGLCGIYTRVARRLGVDRSFVSRVARGQRRSKPIEDALLAEYDRVESARR
jgi:transcriptional regulator with XRE-family HTH domain